MNRGLTTLSLCLGLLSTPAAAGSVRSWSASAADEFVRGTLDGTAIDEEGRVRVAIGAQTLWGPQDGIVWDVVSTADGAIFVALSSPARVVRVAGEQDAEVWWQSDEEHLVAAIADDGQGGLIVGVSPEGRLDRVTSAGQIESTVETGALFVWAMTLDDAGSLWVGTGLPGTLLRRRPDGSVEKVFESGDDPIRCIANHPDGGVLVGTGGKGQVIRFDETGDPFVVFDADEKEIVSIDVAPDGTAYVLAARGSKQVRTGKNAAKPQVTEQVTVVATAPSDAGDGAQQPPQEPEKQATNTKRLSSPPGAVLYRLGASGDARRIWTSSRDVPFSVLHAEGHGVLVATGDKGRVFRIDEHGRAAVVLEIPSDQASTLAQGSDGRVLIGGTTDARVETLGPSLLDRGSYMTPAIDAGTVSDWGRLAIEADIPRGAKVTVWARTGNTAEPDETWTEWAGVSLDPEAAAPQLVSTRWLQARLELVPSRKGVSPLLRRLELRYLPRNRSPVIDELAVQGAGIVWTRSAAQSSRPRGPLLADDPVSRRAVSALTNPKTRPIRRSYEQGARTVSWKASDPDKDTLVARLEIRREDRAEWVPLADDIKAPYFGWDTRDLPDGLYRVRLSVSDSRDNPVGKEQGVERVSSVFKVDNTRPFVQEADIRLRDDRYAVDFVASDPGGNVAAVEVAVDGGEWEPLDPLDGVADSDTEHYQMSIQPTDEPRSLRVRVTDGSGNLGGDAWAFGAESER